MQKTFLDIRASLFLPYLSECMCATGVDSKKAHDFIFKLKYPDDACLACFVKCSATKVGFFDSNGNPLHLDSLGALAPNVSQERIDYCNGTVQGVRDLCRKTFMYSKCITATLIN
ncbi:hypothetical protein FQR65_LT01990 [Abscondita terminalis]|nr:hypothetical protein FQR65_LT01990 [Abscondita terminalis]